MPAKNDLVPIGAVVQTVDGVRRGLGEQVAVVVVDGDGAD